MGFLSVHGVDMGRLFSFFLVMVNTAHLHVLAQSWRVLMSATRVTGADPVTSDHVTPPGHHLVVLRGHVSAVVTRAQTRSMAASTRCDTPEVPRSDTTLQRDTDMIHILQPLNDDMLPCLQDDSSDNRRPSIEPHLVQSRSTGNVSVESDIRTIASDVEPNVASHQHSDSDDTAADGELDSDEDQRKEMMVF